MTLARKLLAHAVAVALGAAALAPLPANASLMTSPINTSFSGLIHSLLVQCGPVSTSNCNLTSPGTSVGIGSVSLTQFDPSQGVLTGTTIELNSTRTQTISGQIFQGQATTTTMGTGTSDAKLTAPGVNATFGQITTSGSASGAAGTFGPTTDSGTATDTGIISAAGGALNDYVGTGTVTANLATATEFRPESSFTNGIPNKTISTATYQLDWSGAITSTYDYLLHAAPAFDSTGDQSLTLSFGNVTQNSTVSPLSFSIFNLLGSGVNFLDQAGLNLDSVSGPAGSPLTTNLATFSNLLADSSDPFQAFLNTSNLGDFSATYTLGLSDEAIGAAASRNNYSLTLNLEGNVVAPSSVPEPPSLALLGAGLFGISYQRRRRRTKG